MSPSRFTSEAVSRGHPDKVCDQISDAILDAALQRDVNARVAAETLIKDQQVILAGEMTLADPLESQELEQIARDVIRDIGYVPEIEVGFDADGCEVVQLIGRQSPNISAGVDEGEQQGAGDQGIIFGYACDEVPETLMPAPIHYAHALMCQHEVARASGAQDLFPDAKSQVTFRYDADGCPDQIETVVVSTQHSTEISTDELRHLVREQIVDPAVPEALRADEFKLFINPAGRFEIGGPVGYCGLTGRKIIVDTYGGMARHGGGAFSGKDPSKVDRSAAYAARYVARHVVASGWAPKCEVQLAYAIGEPQPVSVRADTFGMAAGHERDLEEALRHVFDLSAGGITDMLGLIDPERRPRYELTARHGHFGNPEFSWEQLDRLDVLREVLGAESYT